jgi:hypothetical protein
LYIDRRHAGYVFVILAYVMIKRLFLFLFIVSAFASCVKEEQPMTKRQIAQKVDSITTIRMKDLDEQARIDLERRIKIEVKVKVDSILNASQVQKIKSDSLLHATAAAKPKDAPPAKISK